LFRLFGCLTLASCLMFGTIDLVHAGTNHGNNGYDHGNNEYNDGHSNRKDPGLAPELAPSLSGAAIALLGGGLLLLIERNRRNKRSN
jgi:hypothetical protein